MPALITDPVLQRAIIDRILRERDPDPAVRPSEWLGPITLPDGRTVGLFLRHAADAVLLDDHGQSILITRRNAPGIGKLATPGGFMEAGETAERTAKREAVEETGISQTLLDNARLLGVLPRLYDRPGDIRVCYRDLPGTRIVKGDLLMIPTQGVCLHIAGDFSRIALRAGDDAGSVRVARIAALRPADFGIADHLPMLRQGLALLNN